jgi:hypothetical protein
LLCTATYEVQSLQRTFMQQLSSRTRGGCDVRPLYRNRIHLNTDNQTSSLNLRARQFNTHRHTHRQTDIYVTETQAVTLAVECN